MVMLNLISTYCDQLWFLPWKVQSWWYPVLCSTEAERNLLWCPFHQHCYINYALQVHIFTLGFQRAGAGRLQADCLKARCAISEEGRYKKSTEISLKGDSTRSSLPTIAVEAIGRRCLSIRSCAGAGRSSALHGPPMWHGHGLSSGIGQRRYPHARLR